MLLYLLFINKKTKHLYISCIIIIIINKKVQHLKLEVKKMEKTYIQNLNGLAMQIGRFDGATTTQLTTTEGETLEQWQGIRNANTGKVASIASGNYKIILHNDVAQAVVEGLGAKGIEVKGLVVNDNNRMKLDLVFTNQGVPIKDNATGVQMGIRVLNSYDKTTSFRMEMFGYRMICQNGMALGSVMNDVKQTIFHMGKEKPLQVIRILVDNFIEEVIQSSSKLQQYINRAMEDDIYYQDVAKLLLKYVSIKKHRETILSMLKISEIEVTENGKTNFTYILENGASERIDRWDLYNALTYYATHNEHSMHIENYIQGTAQKVLKNNFKELVVLTTN